MTSGSHLDQYLNQLGFTRQDCLGRSKQHALRFFSFLGETFVFDTAGVPWTTSRIVNLENRCSGIFTPSEPILWEPVR